jgi:hypothetical protein
MKKFLIILSLALAASACHQPEYVLPTAERQGITSLTAYFTFGPFVDQEMAKLDISDPEATRFVIPVPFYYPETSDDETEIYMIKARVQAELQPNCKIEPGLNVLDLTEENHFTYTDASGKSRNIVITGERVHSSKAQLLTFDIVDPPISGLIDEDQHKVSLVSADDLSAAVATASCSAHATITPDLSEPHDYNNGFKVTVIAANGVDKTEYTVVKEVPEKIDYGFNTSSLKQLFNMDPVSNLGMPAYTELVYPTLAVSGNNLVICMGDGSAPVYVNKLTGVKLGTIALGSAPAAGITSDEAGNILLSNHVDGGGEFSLWVTSSVTEEPVLFHTFANTTDLPMGRKIRVIGDVKSEAQIVATLEGIDGVTTSSKFWVLKVEGGKVVSAEVKDVAGTGLAWGSAPVNGTAICGASVNPADGWFGAAYDANVIHWLKADGTDGATAGTSDGNSWGWNCNNFDSKRFNNANYLTMFVVSHFPAWGIGPRLYLYDVTNPASLSGDFGDTGALVMSNTSIGWFQTGSYAIASGDVVLAPSADGFMLYVYYYDHNSQVLGGYSADCIKR